MRSLSSGHRVWHGALVGAAFVLGASCNDGAWVGTPAPGATIIRGTESLAWSQSGDVSGIRFRIWIDDTPNDFDTATCDTAAPEATCSSPLPPMADGVHTVALTSVLTGSELESEPSEPLLLQKVSGRAARLASLPDAGVATGALRLRSTFRLDDVTFSTEVIARGIHAPAQLTMTPDGRLLVGEADGAIRVVPWRTIRRVDAGARLLARSSAMAGAPGLAVHPDFANNRFVYAAVLETVRPSFARMRVLRFREVADTLGDPATLFETSVVASQRASGVETAPGAEVATGDAPRLAFGPDGLLYVALPSGFEFDREPAASSPHPSMLRLGDDGLPAAAGPLTGVHSHPVAFTWHPSTRVLWLAFEDGSGTATLEAVMDRPVAVRPTALIPSLDRLRLPAISRRAPTSHTLVVGQPTGETWQEMTRTMLSGRPTGDAGVFRLTMPVVAGAIPDRIGDIVSGSDGSWFVVTSNGSVAGGTGPDGGDVIVRLTPVRAQ